MISAAEEAHYLGTLRKEKLKNRGLWGNKGGLSPVANHQGCRREGAIRSLEV